VLIHAGIADLRMWDEQVEAFKRRCQVGQCHGSRGRTEWVVGGLVSRQPEPR
jgi:hypothetical protein